MSAPIPTPSAPRFVLFTITEEIARGINAQRTSAGVATKRGNTARQGDIYPLLIVRVWDSNPEHVSVNGQLFLDGNDTYWITSAEESDSAYESQEGRFHWPTMKDVRHSKGGGYATGGLTFTGPGGPPNYGTSPGAAGGSIAMNNVAPSNPFLEPDQPEDLAMHVRPKARPVRDNPQA